MNIENPTLAEKQAFWNEQLPIFKEHYIMQAQLDVLYFDNESGNFEIKEESAVDFEKEDFLEAYHSVNTGWSMWKRAVNHMQKKLEGCVVVTVERLDRSIEAIETLFEDDPTLALGELLPIQQDIKAMVEAARGGNHE